jgi:hypothetical protein
MDHAIALLGVLALCALVFAFAHWLLLAGGHRISLRGNVAGGCTRRSAAGSRSLAMDALASKGPLPPEAVMCSALAHVRDGPEADTAPKTGTDGSSPAVHAGCTAWAQGRRSQLRAPSVLLQLAHRK